MRKGPIIDHDPHEPSHKALKLIAVLTVVFTLAGVVLVSSGLRWGVDQLPIELVMLLAGAAMGISGGFFIGRWDTLRQFRTPGKD